MHPHRKLIKAYPKIRFNSFQRCNTLLRQPLRLHIFAFFPLWQNVLCGTAPDYFHNPKLPLQTAHWSDQTASPRLHYNNDNSRPGAKLRIPFLQKISWARKAVMEHCPKVGFSLVQSFRIRGAQVSAHQSFDSASYSCRGLWIPGYSSVIAGASACSQPQN